MATNASRDELLKEYELALHSLHSTNAVAYTATGLFITLSVAGATYFLRIGGTIYWSDVIGAAVVGFFSSGVVLIWRRFMENLRVRNWISMFRAREIESSLGMRHEKYIDHAYYPDPHPCSAHDYLHKSEAEALQHLRAAVARGAHATVLSPFSRLVFRGNPYPSGTVGHFWDLLTLAIPSLWIAVVLVNVVTKLARG